MQVGTCFRTKDADLKKKLDLWLGPWSLTSSYNLDLKPLGPWKTEPLKKLKSSRFQMFFKIGSIKNSAIFTGKHQCWGLFLIKMQVKRSSTFLKIDPNTGVSYGYCKIFKNSFLIQHLRWLLVAVLPRYSKVSWGACSLISLLHVPSLLNKIFHEMLHK